jgi:hypothetical protein
MDSEGTENSFKSGGRESWLMEKDESELPSSNAKVLDETDADGMKKALLKRCYNIAMANFMMTFTSEGLMGLVYKAHSKEWPAGKASFVVKALLAKYMPRTGFRVSSSGRCRRAWR